MPKAPHVALLIETSRAYGRGLLQGVTQYLREHGPWSVYFQPHGLGAPPPTWLRNWHGDGILARIDDRRMAKAILQTGLPTVDLRFSVKQVGLAGVGIENHSVVRLAFQHLADCGFKQFGFCGLPRGQNTWMDLRRELFVQQVCASGAPCHVFQAAAAREPKTWEQEQEELSAWIRGLPRPVGVMTCNDDRGLQVLDACRRIRVAVPEEVAVIGVDNDEILCNLSSPKLSSVDINTTGVGYQAAALLDAMIAGEPPPAEPVLLAPRGIVLRESTDVLATEDRELAEAIRQIRQHACTGLRLKDFERVTSLPRRTLERRMLKLLGRSPKDEITRVQLERARALLAETDLSAALIAEKCGFSQAKYFSQVFHEKVGVTPTEYRRQHRNR